jgi:hypothetical protein
MSLGAALGEPVPAVPDGTAVREFLRGPPGRDRPG